MLRDKIAGLTVATYGAGTQLIGYSLADHIIELTRYGNIFTLTKEDVLICAEQLGIPSERITDDVLHQVKKGVEFGLEYWSDVMKVAIEEALG